MIKRHYIIHVVLCLLLTKLNLVKTNADCSSPVDCYVKAVDLLNRDRDEFRKTSDKIIADNKDTLDSVNKVVAELKSQIVIEYEKRLSQLEASFNSTIQQYEGKITHLESELENLKVSNGNRHFMFKEAVVYQNVIEALEKGVISQYGNPVAWDDQTYRVNEFNKRKMIRIGTNAQSNENGLMVKVPEGYNMLWIRSINDRTQVFRVRALDVPDLEIVEKYTCFKRNLNEISPDGGAADSFAALHKWCPIPLHKKGNYIIHTDINTEGWISGIAFSKNLWNMAKNGALAYFWAVNGGTKIPWNSDSWNNDVLASIQPGVISELIVPVVPSGKDKLLYIIEHNNNWDGVSHNTVTVNSHPIERFRTTYMNPFSFHVNSKLYSRYIAARVPKELIPEDAKFINVKIDLVFNDNAINFREIGTHDYLE